jgi:hypothetical protein
VTASIGQSGWRTDRAAPDAPAIAQGDEGEDDDESCGSALMSDSGGERLLSALNHR